MLTSPAISYLNVVLFFFFFLHFSIFTVYIFKENLYKDTQDSSYFKMFVFVRKWKKLYFLLPQVSALALKVIPK